MTSVVYVAQSLDGYLAGPRGELDWLDAIDNPDGSDFGFADFLSGVDALVMGRNTFEKVATFEVWPYDKPVFVASGTLSALPARFGARAFLIGGSPAEIVEQLHARALRRLYIDGGMLIQSFLRAGLIDELIVTTIPVLLGDGIPLFGRLPASVRLRLLSAEVLVNQLVRSHYRVDR